MLSSYGWVDRRRGIVRIPIDEAMRLLADPKTAEAHGIRPFGQGGRNDAMTCTSLHKPEAQAFDASPLGLAARAQYWPLFHRASWPQRGQRGAVRRTRIDQRLDEQVPLDLVFRDETGASGDASRSTSAASR